MFFHLPNPSSVYIDSAKTIRIKKEMSVKRSSPVKCMLRFWMEIMAIKQSLHLHFDKSQPHSGTYLLDFLKVLKIR